MATAFRPLRVLVADDEHVIADSLVTILRNHGFESASVYSGYSEMEMAFAWVPDVIISDISMPDVNGIDAVLSMARRLPNTKFLLFSGQSHGSLSRARDRCLKFVFFEKPVQPQSVIEYLKGCEAELNAQREAASA
jgi:DNA-binding NtrC family response regulator